MLLQSRIVVFSQGSPSNFVGFLLVMTLNPCKLCGVNNACRSFHQNNTQAWTSRRMCLVWFYPVLGDLIKQGHWAYHRCPNMDDAGFNELKTWLKILNVFKNVIFETSLSGKFIEIWLENAVCLFTVCRRCLYTMMFGSVWAGIF